MPAPRIEARPPEGGSFVVPATLPREEAEKTTQAVLRGLFRPSDIRQAQLAPLALVFVPIWRVDVGVEVFHVGIRPSPGMELRWVLPTGGFRHRDDVVLMSARRFYPIDPTKTQNPLTRVRLPLHEMVPEAEAPRDPGAEWISADIPLDEAVRDAAERVRRQVQPQGALYASFAARLRSAALCHYPLWVLRYRYTGEAARAGVEECHLAVSARTGKIVSERHPSLFWSVVSRARSLFRTPAGA
jgi:hypothetical protein